MEPDSRTAPPAPPPGEPPLAAAPLDLWRLFAPAFDPLRDPLRLGSLAAAHDDASGGYGAYWLGRAIIDAALCEKVDNWLGYVRRTLDRWRTSGAYGSDLPPAERPARAVRAAPRPAERAIPAAGERVSDLSILTSSLPGPRKAFYQRRFAAALDAAAKRAILAEAAQEAAAQEHPDARPPAAAD